MIDGAESQVACIFRANNPNQIIGSGILLNPKIVMTCAHVVCDALELPRDTLEKPRQKILLSFPANPDSLSKEPQSANIVEWVACQQNPESGILEDFVILELDEPIESIKCQPIMDLGFFASQKVITYEAYGYGKSDGDWSCGECAGRNGAGWIQGDQNKREILPGCSGGAVFDRHSQQLIGMIVAKEEGEQMIYFMPVDSFISRLKPFLGQDNSPLFSETESDVKNKQKQAKNIAELLAQHPRIKKILQQVLALDADAEATVLADQWVDIQSEQALITRLDQLVLIAARVLKDGRTERIEQGLCELHSYTLALSYWIKQTMDTFIDRDKVVQSTFKTAAFNEAGLAAHYNIPPNYHFDAKTREVRGKHAFLIDNPKATRYQKDWQEKLENNQLSDEEQALKEVGFNEDHVTEYLIQELACKVLTEREHFLEPHYKKKLNYRLKLRRGEAHQEIHRFEAIADMDSSHVLADAKVCKLLKSKLSELPVILHRPGKGIDEAEICNCIDEFYEMINQTKG